jgi:hypothetical protein
MTIIYIFLVGQFNEIFCFRFFSRIFFPKAPGKKLGSFKIFAKIRREFSRQGVPTVSTKTGDKLAADVNYTIGK